MIYIVPKVCNHNNVEAFLQTSEPIFSLKDKLVPNSKLETKNIKEISILGLLLIYKFIDYTYQNNCFRKPDISTGDIIEEAWEKYEFRALIDKYISNKDITETAYKNFKVKVEINFIIAPQVLLRSNQFSKDSLKNEFIPKLSSYYKNDEKTVLMLCTCLSEVLLNFWEHAIDDNRSIIIAEGTKNKIEIACADNGDGIITSLRQNKKYANKTPFACLKSALEKGVTSKEDTDHMGYGLWIINEIVSRVKGKLYIYSEGYSYKNNHGKIKIAKCAYWKGTIVYLHLPIKDPVTFCDIFDKTDDINKLSEIKINFK